MKKSLLLLCLAGAVSTLSAQKVADYAAQNLNGMVRTTVPEDSKKMVQMSVQQAPYSAEQKLYDDGTTTAHEASALYRTPYGSLYETLTPDWMGKSVTLLYTPALMDLTWQSYCKIDSKFATKENLGWTVNKGEGPVNIDSLMTDDGDLVMHSWGMIYAPEVHVYAPEDAEHAEALESYTLTRNEVEPEKSYLIAGMDTLQYLGYANINAGIYGGFSNGGQFTSNTNFLILEKNEQTGKGDWKDTGKKCVGFAQYFEAPSDMLYVTSVYMNCYTEDEIVEGAVLEGKELTLNVYRVKEDGEFEPFATTTSSEYDVLMDDGTGSFTFRFVEDDPIFGEMEAPVIMDSTSDYFMTITGFEELTASWTCPISLADGFLGHGYALLDDGSLATIGYTNAPNTPQVDLYISLETVMPVAQSTENMKDVVVMIPAEGGYGMTVYDEEEQDWYLDYDIYTENSSEWWEEVEVPDWIMLEYEDDYVEQGVLCVYVSTEEALPAGMDYRYGEVILSLFGKEVKIPVAQGELPSGVRTKSVKSAKPVYFNIKGQQEMNPAKGKVYITDGQKVVF